MRNNNVFAPVLKFYVGELAAVRIVLGFLAT